MVNLRDMMLTAQPQANRLRETSSITPSAEVSPA